LVRWKGEITSGARMSRDGYNGGKWGEYGSVKSACRIQKIEIVRRAREKDLT
jgi:hypothetical protein